MSISIFSVMNFLPVRTTVYYCFFNSWFSLQTQRLHLSTGIRKIQWQKLVFKYKAHLETFLKVIYVLLYFSLESRLQINDRKWGEEERWGMTWNYDSIHGRLPLRPPRHHKPFLLQNHILKKNGPKALRQIKPSFSCFLFPQLCISAAGGLSVKDIVWWRREVAYDHVSCRLRLAK